MPNISVTSLESSSEGIPVTQAPLQQGELKAELSRFAPRINEATPVDREELAAKTLAYIDEETKPPQEVIDIRHRVAAKAAKKILAS